MMAGQYPGMAAVVPPSVVAAAAAMRLTDYRKPLTGSKQRSAAVTPATAGGGVRITKEMQAAAAELGLLLVRPHGNGVCAAFVRGGRWCW